MSKPKQSYGKTAERILEDVMGLETTRPKEVTEALHYIYQLLQAHELIRAREEIAKVRQDLHGDDPELIRAEVLLKRKELIGK